MAGFLAGVPPVAQLHAAPPQASAGPSAADAARAATVTIDVLDDGRCHVAAEGQGFRSNATYTPQAAATPGEHRCAMPPVPKGFTVNLKVVLPKNARRPSASEPTLDWQTAADGRWAGSGSLTDWPEVVVVKAPGQTWTFWAPVAIAVILGAIGLRRRRAGRART